MELRCGIKIGIEQVSILLYADGIVLLFNYLLFIIYYYYSPLNSFGYWTLNKYYYYYYLLLSDSGNGLQSMLTYLNKWCMQWCLDINVFKSNIIHFRPKKVPISQVVFKSGTKALRTIDTYTYIGVILDEHMTFCFELYVYEKFAYDKYSQLYDACVIPTMLYGAEVFGYISPSNFETKI